MEGNASLLISGQLILTSLNSSKSICPSSFVSNSSRARAKFPGNIGLALLMLMHRTAVECREGKGRGEGGELITMKAGAA